MSLFHLLSNLQLAWFLCLAGAILDIVGMGNLPLGIFSGKNILYLLEPSKLMSFLTISNETPPAPRPKLRALGWEK